MAENAKVKDNLTKEQQAAIEAEEQCTKLEAMKSKLEDEVSVRTSSFSSRSFANLFRGAQLFRV